jgi:NAD(P)-dependent dehydrogenase (short-subunit alcohol dehydrogenase family)
VTADGHELTFQANHLAPFLLTELLLPRLLDSARGGPVRVITTSSLGNRFGRVRIDDLEWEKRRYAGGWIAYCTSKLMNIMFTRELARRTAGSGIEATCFHPDPGRGNKVRAGAGQASTPNRFASDSRIARALARTPLARLLLTSEDGAEPLVWLATSVQAAGANGAYFSGFTRDAKVHPQADDPELAARLWARSAAFVGAYR